MEQLSGNRQHNPCPISANHQLYTISRVIKRVERVCWIARLDPRARYLTPGPDEEELSVPSNGFPVCFSIISLIRFVGLSTGVMSMFKWTLFQICWDRPFEFDMLQTYHDVYTG